MSKTVDKLFEQANVTVKEVAAKIGLDPQRVQAICRGRWLASPQERQLIADVFDVSVDEIDWGHTMSPRNVRYHRFGLQEDF